MKDTLHTIFPSLLLVMSIIGLLIVIFLVTQSSSENLEFEGQRAVIGVIYSILCISGIVTIFYPVKCKNMFQHGQNLSLKASASKNSRKIEGHHPGCQNFSRNRLLIMGRFLCAACSGLLIGAIISLILTFIYFFNNLESGWGSVSLVVLGEILMLIGLVQIRSAGLIKGLLNSLFVFGSFVILASVDALQNSFFIDLYVLGLILFLLWFRMYLSEWNNRRICFRCQRCF